MYFETFITAISEQENYKLGLASERGLQEDLGSRARGG